MIQQRKHSKKTVPQRLKPWTASNLYGTAEAVPFLLGLFRSL
jgi:hypothetical protein